MMGRKVLTEVILEHILLGAVYHIKHPCDTLRKP